MNEPETTLDPPRAPGPEEGRRTRGLVRYLQERKGVIRDRAVTVAATLVVLLIGLAGWRYDSARRLGRIVLTNQGIPLLAQLLPESGDLPLGEQFDVVSRSRLTLPEGDYRLRVDGVGRLGRTYRFAVNRGETIAHELSLDEGRLLGGDVDPSRWAGGDRPREEPIPIAMVTRALELTPGRSDIVELTGSTVIRRDAETGKPVWDTAKPKAPYGPGRDPGPWLHTGPNNWAFHVMEPAIDLDGDGTRDVLVVVRNANAFVALSGQDGSMLWNYAGRLDGPGGPQTEARPDERPSGLIGWPAIGDVDRDGTPDLIVTQVFHEFPAEVERRTGKRSTAMTPLFSRRIVLAISGRSGRWLWTFPLERTFVAIKSQYWDRPAVFLRSRSKALVAILDGSREIVVDPATGRPRSEAVDLGFEPVRPVQYADLDGDGEPEIVALGPGSSTNQQSMAVYSLGRGKGRWTASIAARYPRPGETGSFPEWPWLTDLDGDGRSEVIVPDSGPIPRQAGYRGFRVLDGFSGAIRWVRPMRPETKAEDGLDHIIDAPDLDGDSVHELVAVSRFDGRNPPVSRTDRRSEPERIYVDALSGADGHRLWSWHVDLPENKLAWKWVPHWWGRGPDGWPLLAMPLGGPDRGQPGAPIPSSQLYPPAVHFLEASTGRELSQATGLFGVGVADLDGDGLTDLWGEADGQLRAFRGEPPEVWRALGAFPPARNVDLSGSANMGHAAADLNGDGIADTWSGRLSVSGDSTSEETGSRTAIARSGSDGHVLWKTALDPPWLPFHPEPRRSYRLGVFPLPAGDLDGDGTADVVVHKYSQEEAAIGRQRAALPIQVLSGRDGRPLWSAGPLPLGFEAYGFSEVTWFLPRVIEPNAPSDLLVLHRSPFVKASAMAGPPSPALARLARVSGRTGRVVWDIPLEAQPSSLRPPGPLLAKLDDLDGDGILDAAVLARQPAQTGQPEFELKVISLHDGAKRWSRALDYHYQSFVSEFPQVEVGKATSDEPAAVFVTEMPTTNTSSELLVHALDGRDGSERWTWSTGVGEGDRRFYGGIDAIALDREGKDSVCVTYTDRRRECRIVILDPQGKERARRVLPREPVPTIYWPPVGDYMIDLDGDGRDELIVWNDNRLQAWGSDLKDRWSIPAEGWQISRLLPASPGRSSTLVLPPTTAIDGKSGQVRWIVKSPSSWNRFAADLLDPGDPARLPRLIFTRNVPLATVCRYAMPATPRGDYLPASGARSQPGLARDDPRWTRLLPWMNLMSLQTAGTGLLAVVGLALLNVFLPLGVLRLAARRRPWSLRVLMALPVAAAVPLSAFLALEPLMPIPKPPSLLPSSPMALFVLGSLAGVPVISYVVLAGFCLARRQWRTLAKMAGVTVLASLAIAGIWVARDLRDMPSIEQYSRSGWYLALLPGAFIVSALAMIGWAIRGIRRWIRWRAMRTGC